MRVVVTLKDAQKLIDVVRDDATILAKDVAMNSLTNLI
jgi:hypothetical protein